MEIFQSFFVSLWDRTETKFIAGHVLLNLFIALAKTLSSNSFNLRKLSGFMTDKLIPYIGVFAIATQFESAMHVYGLSTVAWGLIQTSLLAQTVDSLGKMGIPFPMPVLNLVRQQPFYYEEPDKAYDLGFKIKKELIAKKTSIVENEKNQVGD